MSRPQPEKGAKPPADAVLAALGRCDFGVFTFAEAAGRGVTSDQLSRRTQTGVLARPHPRVYVLKGVAPSWEQRAMAALKWIGNDGALSHRSAARLWGLLQVHEVWPLELSCPRRLQPRGASVVMRRIGGWRPGDLCLHNRLRVTTRTRTMMDLASVLSEERLRSVLEDALVNDLIDLNRLRRRIQTEGTQGRRGLGRLLGIIAELDGSSLLPRSELERRFIKASIKAELRQPTVQFPVHVGERSYLLDFAYPEEKLAVEMDGWRFHGGRSAWEADIARSNDLVAQGWRVVRGTWRDIQTRPDAFINQIKALLEPRLFDEPAHKTEA